MWDEDETEINMKFLMHVNGSKWNTFIAKRGEFMLLQSASHFPHLQTERKAGFSLIGALKSKMVTETTGIVDLSLY